MKRILILFLCLPVLVLAEGMPIKSGRINTDKTVIELGGFQCATANLFGFVHLSDAQKEMLPSNVAIRNNILYLHRLSEVEKGCTCFLGECGILVDSSTVDFPHFLAGSEGDRLGVSFILQIIVYGVSLAGIFALLLLRRISKKKKIEQVAASDR